ncbi:hypothetical protein ACTFIU_003599 [Dictyostelium citrinum]
MNGIDHVIKILLEDIESSQINNKNNEKNDWEYINGSFPMFLNVNFSGNEVMNEARRKISIPDQSGFLTNFVLQCLIEGENYGYYSLNKMVVERAITSLFEFYDKNFIDSCIVGFHSQYYDEKEKIYVKNPKNIEQFYKNFSNITNEKLSSLFNIDENLILKLRNELKYLSSKNNTTFSLPADFDSTYSNVQIGYLIKGLNKNCYKSINEKWDSFNDKCNKEGLLNYLIKYSFTPFSNNPNNNSIDPRCYYYLKDFINDSINVKKRKGFVIMIPYTYVMNQSEQIEKYPSIQIPNLVNHVDISVLGNVLFGLLLQYNDLIKSNSYMDIIKSIVYLFEFVFETNLIYKRSDILLLYYPTIYSLFWFISRSYYFLKTIYASTFPSEFGEILHILKCICENYITKKLVDNLIINNEKNEYYWEDYLGNNDYNKNFEQIKYGEDRFFSTSLSIDTLLNIWTIKNKMDGKINYQLNINKDITKIIKKSSKYILNNILLEENEDKLSNVFFSSLTKGPHTKNINFPFNVHIDASTGKTCKIDEIEKLNNEKKLIVMVSGNIDEIEYQKIIDEKNNSFITSWSGNFNDFPFLMWNSKIFTKSISLLVLTKFKSLYLK